MEKAVVHERAESPNASAKRAGKFQELPRFYNDGTNKIPNFINGRSTEGRELIPLRIDVDTNTHTLYEDRLCGTSESTMTLVREIARSMTGRAGVKTIRARTATHRGLRFSDGRFDQIKSPYAENIGPGSYDIEVSFPGVGTYRPESPLRTTSPSRDPARSHAAFQNTMRQELFKLNAGACHLGSYINPDFKGLGDRAPEWYKSSDKRASVSDYRYSTRHSEMRKEVPADREGEVSISACGMPTTVAACASIKPAAAPFMSKQARFAILPQSRNNDVRLGSHRSDEDPGSLGPGSYGGLTSIGGATRNTYRMFTDAASSKKAPPPLRSPSKTGAQFLTPLYSSMCGPASPSFAGTGRSQKFGPFSMSSDSSMTSRPL